MKHAFRMAGKKINDISSRKHGGAMLSWSGHGATNFCAVPQKLVAQQCNTNSSDQRGSEVPEIGMQPGSPVTDVMVLLPVISRSRAVQVIRSFF